MNPPPPFTWKPVRFDFAAIARFVAPGARVLDLGCGDGELLAYLREARGAEGYGVEIADEAVLGCARRGVAVVQMDLEAGLSIFEDQSFDYAILSQVLQRMKHVELVTREMTRVAKEAIVAFPNFGYWRHRLQVLRGRMPVSETLPEPWYATPNVHLCTLLDFEEFCQKMGFMVFDSLVMHRGRVIRFLPNLRGSLAMIRFQAKRYGRP